MTHPIRLVAPVPLLLLVSLLTACGFQLRGQMNLNSDLTRLAVSGGDSLYIRQLTKALNNNGIEVTDAAPYRLRILSVEKKGNKQIQASAGRYERQLVLTAAYQLETQDGLALFGPVELSNSRYISYDQNQTNAAQAEENLAYKELTQELVYTTVRRVAGISGSKLEEEVARARKARQVELNSEEAQ